MNSNCTFAALNGHNEAMKILLDAKADVNSISSSPLKETPLISASISGHLDAVKILVEAGANVNVHAGSDDWNALMWSLRRENSEVAEYLIVAGADVHASYLENYTALHIAAYTGNYRLVELIISKGAQIDTRVTDTGGATPLMIAVEQFGFVQDEAYYEGRKRVLKALVDAGADINAKDNWVNEESSIFMAVKDMDLEMVKILCMLGADLTLKNKKGHNALDLAIILEAYDIANFLDKFMIGV